MRIATYFPVSQEDITFIRSISTRYKSFLDKISISLPVNLKTIMAFFELLYFQIMQKPLLWAGILGFKIDAK